MAKDFKAKQLRTHKVIASGSNVSGGEPSLLVYSASAASDQIGTHPASMLANVGSDVFMFVSGTVGDGSALSRKNVSLFGGDVVVSGTLFMERIVAEVDNVTNSDHYISGSLIVENKATSQPLVTTNWGSDSDTIDVSIALSADGGGEGAIAFDWKNSDGAADALIFEASKVLVLSASAYSFGAPQSAVKQDAGLSKRKDTNFFVSGAIGSEGNYTEGAVSVFGGDLIVSGNLRSHNGNVRVYKSSDTKNDYFQISVGNDGQTDLTTKDGAGNGGHLSLGADGDIKLDTETGLVKFAKDGDAFLQISSPGTDTNAVLKNIENGKDIIFQQFDGNETLRLTDDNRVLVLSGGAATSPNMGAAPDVNFFVSGTIGSANSSTKGTALFGGDLVVSGNLYANLDSVVVDDLSVGDTLSASGTIFVGQDIEHIGDSNTKITFTDDNVAFKVGGITAIDLSNSSEAGRVDKIFIGGKGASDKMHRVLILSGGQPGSVDEASGDDVVFYVSGSVGTNGHVGGSAALFGGDLVVSGNVKTAGTLTVSAPGVGKDVIFYGEDSSATGLHWDADHAEHGGLVLGADDHGVELIVHGETAGRSLHWDQSLDTLNLSGKLTHRAGDVYFNALQEEYDFKVDSNNRTAIKVSATDDMVTILSMSDGNAPDPSTHADVNLYVSGVINSRGSTAIRGTTLFAGDLVTSGNYHVINGKQIRVHGLNGGSDEAFTIKKFGPGGGMMAPTSNMAILQNRSGSVVVGLGTGSLAQSDHKFVITEMGNTNNKAFMAASGRNGGQIVFLSGANASANDIDYSKTATDISFFVSGAVGGKDKTNGAASVFAGDVVISGALHGGSPLQIGEYRSDLGTDVTIFISGTKGSANSATKGTALFGGDVYVSGALYADDFTVTDDLTIGDDLTVNGMLRVNNSTNNHADFTVNADGALTIATTESDSDDDADITLDADGAINIDTQSGLIKLKHSGSNAVYFNLDFDGHNAGIYPLDTRDIVFKAGSTQTYAEIYRIDTSAGVLAVATNKKLTFDGPISQTESIHGDGTNLYLDSSNAILFHSGGAAGSVDEAKGLDISFYVSGTTNSHGTATKGTALFGGDLVSSGTLYFSNTLKSTNNSNSYLEFDYSAGGTNSVRLVAGDREIISRDAAGSLDSILINNGAAAISTVIRTNAKYALASKHTTNTVYVNSDTASEDGADTSFWVSGSIGSMNTAVRGTAVFGGDLVASGGLTSLGSLGVGTVSPLSYNDSADGLVVYRDGNGGITIAGGTNDYGSLYFADGTGGGNNHQGAVQYHHGADKLYLGAGGTDNHVTLDGTGKLGIGTTTPQSKLDVEGGVSIGTGYAGSTAAPTNSLIVEGYVGVGTVSPDGYNDSADNLVVYEAGNGGITIANGVNDYGTIYFADGTGGSNNHQGAVQYHHGTDKLFFGTAGNDQRVTIDSAGKVGIGTTSPGHALTVVGAMSASLGITGSLTQLNDGTSYLIAGNNITISSASNGSVTITGAAGGGSVNVKSGSTSGTASTLDLTESGLLNSYSGGYMALTGTLGNPSDGVWSDGLFTGFNAQTTIGSAVDRINEVLKFLAPSPAPAADNINAAGSAGSTAKVSFGPDRNSDVPTGYTAVGSIGTLSAVNVNSSYAPSTGSGGDLRVGIFNAPFILQGVVNSDVIQTDYNSGATVNYSGSAFGDADQGNLVLDVNGSAVKSVDLSDPAIGIGNPLTGSGAYYGSSAAHNNSGFINLSQTGSAVTQAGVSFDIFKYRTSNFKIGTGSMRKGWNYAKVRHVIGSNSTVTNHVEWLYDQDGNDSASSIVAEGNAISADTLLGGANRYDLSGVRYAVTSSGEYRVRVAKFYENVYQTNSITLTPTNATFSSTSPAAVPVLAIGSLASSKFSVTGTWATSATSLLGSTVGGSISVAHPTKTGLSTGGSTTSGRLLIYSASNYSTNTVENFDNEKYRIQSSSYSVQGTVNASSKAWNSKIHMTASNAGHQDGLQFYNSRLYSPTKTLNSGDFRSSNDGGSYFGANLTYDVQPNYSSQSGTRTFFRKIKNTTGNPVSDFKIIAAGSGLTIVNQATALNSSRIKIFARLPGEAGSEWLDLGSPFVYHTTSQYMGGRANSGLDATVDGGGATNYFTFGTGTLANNDYFVIKIEADAAITGYLETLTFALPGIAGTTVSAPNVSTLNTTQGSGADAKLSFGSSKAIVGYTPVTGTSGFVGAVDINAEYTATSTRYGVFDKTTNIVGEVNHSVTSNANSYTADAFGGGNAHIGTLSLNINGVPHHTVDLSTFGSGDSKTGNSGFTSISSKTAAKGTSGNVSDYTKFYRTGDFIVHTDHQRNGRNFARVVHTVTGTDYVTNFVEWVNDSDSDEIALNDASFGEFGDNDFYYQSGVKYFISPSGSFRVRASDAYSAVYSGESDAIKVSTHTNLNTTTLIQVTGSGITNAHAASYQMSMPALDVGVSNPHTQDIFATASVAFSRSTSLPGGSPFAESSYSALAAWTFKHPLDSTSPVATGNVYVGGSSSKKFLVFSGTVAGTTNVNTREDFGREDYRIVSGNYTSQGAIAAGSWDSTKSINAASNGLYYDGLLIYAGLLVSPVNSGLEGNGDFRSVFEQGSSNLISPAGNVNYTSLPAVSSSHRTYIRRFANGTVNNVFNVDVTLRGSANIVGKSGALSGSLGSNTNIYVEGKIPGKTGWLDLGKATAGSGNVADGDGGLNGDIDHTVDGSGAGNNLTFNGQTVEGTGTGPDQLLIKITAHKNWTGNLSRIDISY